MKAARRTYGSHGVLSLATLFLLNSLACGGGSGATSDAGTGGRSLDAASSSGERGGSAGSSAGAGGSSGGASGGGGAGQGGGAGGHSGGASGGGGAGQGGGGGGHSGGGASGGGGSGTAGGGGALPGSGGGGAGGNPSNPQCPATPPGPSSCPKEGFKCTYDDCPASGRTIATCTSGTWSVATGACGTVTCMGLGGVSNCGSGQLCLVRITGAMLPTCIANTCGAGPITPQCLPLYYNAPPCTLIGTVSSGITVYCDYCGTMTCE